MFKFLEAVATMVALKLAMIFQCKYVEVDDQNDQNMVFLFSISAGSPF